MLAEELSQVTSAGWYLVVLAALVELGSLVWILWLRPLPVAEEPVVAVVVAKGDPTVATTPAKEPLLALPAGS